MATGIVPQPFTIPTDEVSLHRWDETAAGFEARNSEVFGDQIGDRITTSVAGLITFPAHTGPRASVHVIAWHEGKPMWCGPRQVVAEGDTVSTAVPIRGHLVSV